MPAPYSAPSIPAAASSAQPVGEPDQLPQRRAGTSGAVSGPQVGGRWCVVLLARDGLPLGVALPPAHRRGGLPRC